MAFFPTEYATLTKNNTTSETISMAYMVFKHVEYPISGSIFQWRQKQFQSCGDRDMVMQSMSL